MLFWGHRDEEMLMMHPFSMMHFDDASTASHICGIISDSLTKSDHWYILPLP
jgi:hypothetical protein